MSITFNTSGGANGVTAVTVSFSIAGVNTGDVIVMWVVTQSSSRPTSVVDGQGTYTFIGSWEYDSTSTYGSGIYILPNCVSGTHAGTITLPASQYTFYGYGVYSGASASPVDGANGSVYTTAVNTQSCTITNTSSADMVVSFAVNWNGSATTAYSGTARALGPLGSGINLQDQTQIGPGAITPFFTFLTAADGTMNVVGLSYSSTYNLSFYSVNMNSIIIV